MKSLNIGVRLGIAFSTLLLLLSVIAYLGWSSLAATKAKIDVIVGENNVKIAMANSMLSRLNVVALDAELHYLLRQGRQKNPSGEDRERPQEL